MFWVSTRVPFIALQHHLSKSDRREQLDSILPSQCLSWGWDWFLSSFDHMRWKIKLGDHLGNTLHCSSALVVVLRKANTWFIRRYILFSEGSSPKNTTEYRAAVIRCFLPHNFFSCGKAGDPGLCHYEFRLLYMLEGSPVVHHPVLLGPCHRSCRRKVSAKKHFTRRGTMSSVLLFLLCILNPYQLHKTAWGIFKWSPYSQMLRLLNEGWREGWRQQPKSQVSLTHCCVLAVSSRRFQASNGFCWVTVLQGIFPLWLIPSLTQKRNSKPASDFCSVLPWGKCLGHGKRGFFSFLYHLPLFPGSCSHPASSLGYGNRHSCLR